VANRDATGVSTSLSAHEWQNRFAMTNLEEGAHYYPRGITVVFLECNRQVREEWLVPLSYHGDSGVNIMSIV
jgi:hypothetical protein